MSDHLWAEGHGSLGALVLAVVGVGLPEAGGQLVVVYLPGRAEGGDAAAVGGEPKSGEQDEKECYPTRFLKKNEM